MKKIWGILLVGMSVGVATANPTDEWKHIIQVTQQVGDDEQLQQAVKDVVIAMQKVISLYTTKVASNVTQEERQKIADLVDIAKKMSDIYCQALKDNKFDYIDKESMIELRELAQELINIALPCMLLMQDPSFVNEQKELLQNNYRQAFELIQQMLAQMQTDLKQ
jgi:hypothetical protein